MGNRGRLDRRIQANITAAYFLRLRQVPVNVKASGISQRSRNLLGIKFPNRIHCGSFEPQIRGVPSLLAVSHSMLAAVKSVTVSPTARNVD